MLETERPAGFQVERLPHVVARVRQYETIAARGNQHVQIMGVVARNPRGDAVSPVVPVTGRKAALAVTAADRPVNGLFGPRHEAVAGRDKGAKTLLVFFRKLPYHDARFFAAFVGMVIFIPAGAGGIINASYQLDQVVHNTLWITGHFHLTVASTVALTFFAITYMLIPSVTGRTITPWINRLGIAHTIIWALGMMFMSIPMHIVGLYGEPRRIAYTTYMNHPVAAEWEPYRRLMGIGSVFLFIGVLLFVFIALYLWFWAPRASQPVEFPLGEIQGTEHRPPLILERWSLWIGITLALTILVYTVPVYHLIFHGPPGAIGMRTW